MNCCRIHSLGIFNTQEGVKTRDWKKCKYTLAAHSVCQTVKPQPISLKLWANKASFNQVTCRNSLLNVQPTYFTRHLHLLKPHYNHRRSCLYTWVFQFRRKEAFETKQVCKTTVSLPYFLPNLEPLCSQNYSSFVLHRIRLKMRICLFLPFSLFLPPLTLPPFLFISL